MPALGLPAGYRVISADEAEARYAVSSDVQFPYREFADQEIRLYEGGLRLAGDVSISEFWMDDELCEFSVIVDGDLTVEGDLKYFCGEGTGFFHLVTGSLRVRNLFLSGFPDVVVRGDLTAAGSVHGYNGDDGGILAVGGNATAELIIGRDFALTFGTQPQAIVAGVSHLTNCPVDYTEQDLCEILLPELLNEDGQPDSDKIERALSAGRPALRPDAVPTHLAALAELDGLLARAAEVTDIDLAARKLRTLPVHLFEFPNLRRLSLAGNDLLGGLLGGIGELTGLEELNLAEMRLTELPAAIGRLARLRVLDISGNRFSALPVELGDLGSLTVLRAGWLTCPVPDAIARLSELEELDLSHRESATDEPSVPFPTVVTRLPRLRKLNLSASALGSVPDELLSLAGLEELNLAAALGHVPRLPDLSRLPRLRVLRMSGQGNGDRYPGYELLDSVWTVTTLEELQLEMWKERAEYRHKTKTREVIRPALAALPADAFARMRRLRWLGLAYNQLTTLPESFYRLEHLQFADLRSNQLDPASLNRLRDTFPTALINLSDDWAPAGASDPGRQAVEVLVARGTAKLPVAPAAAIAHFEEALALCHPGAKYSRYDQLYALYGLVLALGQLTDPAHEEETASRRIRYAEQAMALEHHWDAAVEMAFHNEVTRQVGHVLARELSKRGELERALTSVERALTVAAEPAYDHIRDTKVRILLAMGRTHEAYRIADSVLTRDPGSGALADLAASTGFQQWRRASSTP